MAQSNDAGAAGLKAFTDQARIISRALEVNVEGVTHEQSLTGPRPAGNCINWVVGHMALELGLLRRVVGKEGAIG